MCYLIYILRLNRRKTPEEEQAFQPRQAGANRGICGSREPERFLPFPPCAGAIGEARALRNHQQGLQPHPVEIG